VREIGSAADAANALRPIAGNLAFALFALGIIGTGLLAVPILAGSAAYAVSEAFGWVEGLGRKPREAKAFYGVIALATAGGMALNLLAIDPMQALYWAAVVNGLLAPPLMVVTMLIARNPRVMHKLPISRGLAFGGWLSTGVMAVVAGVFLLS
jgi:Mn2+/Fe2+ NRAMP family transporter